ncbi:Serine/threonine-protein kinase AtPK2/AtPK19 [Linum perenne]
MVSSTLATGFSRAKSQTNKPLQSKLLFPMTPPDAVVVTDHLELDFADVFGPLPVQSSVDSNCAEFGELVYDDPIVIHNRSHSLVGPSSYVSQSLKLNKLTFYENEEGSEGSNESLQDESVKELQKSDVVENARSVVGIEDFEVLKVVGQGAFGKVFQVRKNGTSEIYAMKVMRKDKIVEKNHVEYMKAERDILTKVDHPFIVQLKYSFQTKYRLYLVLDFINGGHLFFQLYHQGLFREDLARVYAAEIVSAVSHLHSNGIMHRDLKPENILLGEDGHVMLTDFGLAKEFDENTRSNSMCGTVEYMAPEIIQGKGHDKAADWWSVGVLLYEMLTGKLLQKESSRRLGCGDKGSQEIKNHKWFKPINWKKLETREVQPSFLPNVDGKNCTANFETKWTDMPLLDSPAASPKISVANPFGDFTYVRPAADFLPNGSLMY